jgi:hypothetical protein
MVWQEITSFDKIVLIILRKLSVEALSEREKSFLRLQT